MEIIGRTDTGRVRQTNQDDFSYGTLSQDEVWAVVCDGMGGANGGNVASATAVRVISEYIQKEYVSGTDEKSIRGILSGAVERANAEVYDMSKSEESLVGMGTTVVACIVQGRKAFIAHAGDSRAYLIEKSGARQLTRDHSIVQEMVESGEITPKEAQMHPQKNIITRALGVQNSLEIDFQEVAVAQGNGILICTDGLSNHIEPEDLGAAVERSGFENCADELIRLANENGGSDNITVVVIF